jgi:hypothetical protein
MTPYDLCPHCAAKAVDVTTLSDRSRRFICAGEPSHNWAETDVPESPEAVEAEDVAAEILEAFERIEARLAALEAEVKQIKAKPSWFRRFL